MASPKFWLTLILATTLQFASKRPLKTITVTVSDGFGWFSDGVGRFRIVFGPFSSPFWTVFESLRTVLDHFGALSDRFGTTPLKIRRPHGVLDLELPILPVL